MVAIAELRRRMRCKDVAASVRVCRMVSAWAKPNYVDHTLTGQTSMLRFVEDNFGLNYIDGPAARDPSNGLRTPGFTLAPEKQSFDVVTGSLDNMLDDHPHLQPLILDPVSGAAIQGG